MHVGVTISTLLSLCVQIQEIFGNVGVLMTSETLEAIYRHVATEHPKGHVSVESFRNALDEVQAALIAKGQHPMAV